MLTSVSGLPPSPSCVCGNDAETVRQVSRQVAELKGFLQDSLQSTKSEIMRSIRDLHKKQEELVNRLDHEPMTAVVGTTKTKDEGQQGGFLRPPVQRDALRDLAGLSIHHRPTGKSPGWRKHDNSDIEVEELVSDTKSPRIVAVRKTMPSPRATPRSPVLAKASADEDAAATTSYPTVEERDEETRVSAISNRSSGARVSGAPSNRVRSCSTVSGASTASKDGKLLALTIVSASGLRNADRMSKSDPYCICQVVGKSSSRFTTKVVYNSLAPEWHHEAVVDAYEPGDSIEFRVVDRDIGQDDPLGSAILTSEDFARGFLGDLELTGIGSKDTARLRVKIEWKKGEDARRYRAKVERKNRRISVHVGDTKDEVGLTKLWQHSDSEGGGRLFGTLRDSSTEWFTFISVEADQWPLRWHVRKVIRHQLYEICRSIFLLVDAVVIMFETEFAARSLIDEPVDSIRGIQDNSTIQLLTYILFGFFAFDISLRVIAGWHPYPMWTCFNIFAVFTYVLEAVAYKLYWNERSNSSFRFWVTNIAKLRVFRLLQFAQVTPVGRTFLSDILIIMRSVRGTIRTTACCVFMVVFFLICGGFFFVEGAMEYCVRSNAAQSAETEDLRRQFGTLSQSVLSLFMAISGGDDWVNFYRALSPMSWRYRLTFLGFMCYAVFAFMNVIIAVVVESMMEASKSDRGILVHQELKAKSTFVHNMETVFRAVDQDGSGEISLDELQEHMQDAETCAYFAALGVDAKQVSQLFQLLDEDGSGSINRDEFVKGCLNLRGDAKGIDIAILMRQMDFLLDNMEMLTDTVEPFAEKAEAMGGTITKMPTIRRARSVRRVNSGPGVQRALSSTTKMFMSTSAFAAELNGHLIPPSGAPGMMPSSTLDGSGAL